ncbi:hypothetical protein [Pseudomonas chlororaphis]
MEWLNNLRELCAAYPRISMGAGIGVMSLIMLPLVMQFITFWHSTLDKSVNPPQKPKV